MTKTFSAIVLIAFFAIIVSAQRIYPSRANNWCMDTNATYFASSTYPQFGFSINAAFDGERNSIHWADPAHGGGGWADSTGDTWPDYIGCNIARAKSFERAVVTTYEDGFPQEPYIGLVRGHYGIEDYAIEIHKLDGTWVEVAEVEENENTIRVLTFPSVVGTGCRLRIDGGYLGLSRVVEFECGGAVPEQDGAATNPPE